MDLRDSLAARTLSVAGAVGGWRTIAEAIASRVLFLVAYLSGLPVLPSALLAAGAVLVFAVVRWRSGRRKWWQAAVPLAVVALSAILAGGTGHAVDFYLPEILPDLVLAPAVLLSMLIRFPVVGLLVGGARGAASGWRRDPVRHRLYQRCTAVFLAKFAITAAVMLLLYSAGQVLALGIVGALLSTPALAGCVYLCWRILRAHAGAGDAA